jgi:hypothetical protein
MYEGGSGQRDEAHGKHDGTRARAVRRRGLHGREAPAAEGSCLLHCFRDDDVGLRGSVYYSFSKESKQP